MQVFHTNVAVLLSSLIVAVELKPSLPGIKHIYDLSYTFNNSTIYWPTDRKDRFRFTSRTIVDSSQSYYEANAFSTVEHGGTHIDAPRHFAKGGLGAGEIPVETLVGSGIIVDVEAKAAVDADYLISVSDFESYEKQHGTIEDGIIVLLRTGWGKKWPNATAYLGSATNVSLLHFPGLSEDGAKWLALKRKVKAVGIDTASIDNGQSTDYKAHVALNTRGIPLFENVANLDKLPVNNFMVFALPMKIGQGSGAPLRIIATVGDKISSAETINIHYPLVFVLCNVVAQLLL